MFILRQINNKVNTMTVSMSVICLMLFMTITVLSSSLSLRGTMEKDLKDNTPVDLNLYKTANLPESFSKRDGSIVYYTSEQIEDSKLPISQTLKNNGLDMNKLKDVLEFYKYTVDNITLEEFFGDKLNEVKQNFPLVQYGIKEEIMKISDYNKVARLYKIEEYELNEDEYIMVCNYDNIAKMRELVLNGENDKLNICGKEYKSKYNKCVDGFVDMAGSHVNTGIILVPDSCSLAEENKEQHFLIANYNATTDDEKEEIEKIFSSDESGLIQNLSEKGFKIDGMTKISIIESSLGLATIITFIAIYLGIIFLIASSAILALKQLTESSDNKERYRVLRRIGCDEKMINKTLFRQIGIFFMLPLILAIIHSIFGIQFVVSMLEGVASKEVLLPSIIGTIIVFSIIYGTYFIWTYLGSKSIISEES